VVVAKEVVVVQVQEVSEASVEEEG